MMTSEKKKLNKSSKDYTNSLAAYGCPTCTQDICQPGNTANQTSIKMQVISRHFLIGDNLCTALPIIHN